MLKRIVVLLLFVELSFGQGNESSLELDNEGRFSFGITYKSSFTEESTSQNKMFKFLLGNGLYTTYFNYKVFKKFILGLSIGLQPSFSSYLLEKPQPYYKLGLRLGYVLNDDSQIIFTKSKVLNGSYEIARSYPEVKYYRVGDDVNHSSLSFIYNMGNLSPEIGLTYVSYRAGVSSSNISTPVNGSFIMPSIGLNYKIYPSKKRAIKKLIQAKNALDMGLITQEEYDQIYVKYAHFAKDKP